MDLLNHQQLGSRSGSRWIVVGGGLYGCFAALILARTGAKVVLVEQSDDLLKRASLVNQARIHTGLHYPRSLATAKDALSHYLRFCERFPAAVRDFTQIYAVAKYGSKTSGQDFASFIDRLGVSVDEINPNLYFRDGTITRAFRVEEPSFDANVLRASLAAELLATKSIDTRLNTTVVGGDASESAVRIRFDDGTDSYFDGLVIATYAGINALRNDLGLELIPTKYELTEVLLGEVSDALLGHGFTVMDGPFWSLMPFGHSQLVSLTSVGLTPLRRSDDQPRFSCQIRRTGCEPLHLADCTTCLVRPPTAAEHQIQHLKRFLKEPNPFVTKSSLLTIKAILASTEVDDARPTIIHKERGINVWTLFSGKVSSLFDLELALT